MKYVIFHHTLSICHAKEQYRNYHEGMYKIVVKQMLKRQSQSEFLTADAMVE